MHEVKYALIKNSVVENIIVADDEFIPLIEKDWDFILKVADFPETPCISIGWKYEEGAFVAPVVNQVEAE